MEATTLAKIKLQHWSFLCSSLEEKGRCSHACFVTRGLFAAHHLIGSLTMTCGRAARLAYDPLPAANMQSCTETPLEFDEPLGLFSTFKSMNIPLGGGMQVRWPSLAAHSYLCEEELFPRLCEAVSQFSNLHVLISSCYTCDP